MGPVYDSVYRAADGGGGGAYPVPAGWTAPGGGLDRDRSGRARAARRAAGARQRPSVNINRDATGAGGSVLVRVRTLLSGSRHDRRGGRHRPPASRAAAAPNDGSGGGGGRVALLVSNQIDGFDAGQRRFRWKAAVSKRSTGAQCQRPCRSRHPLRENRGRHLRRPADRCRHQWRTAPIGRCR